ncbi:MAG: hypothetical protein ABFR47_05875 [Verrucomicrobiota bacterium]
MKKHSTEKEILSASLNLQHADVDEETRKRLIKMIKHLQATASILITLGVLLFIARVYFKARDIDIIEFIPIALFLVLYTRYRDLHKQGLKIIKKL